MPMGKISVKDPIAKFLYRIGVSADLLTFLGLFLAFLSGYLIVKGVFFWAAGVLLLSGLCDLMDGAVARASGKSTVFGGILDSSLDRYGDGLVLAGILFYCARHGKYLYAGLAMSAILGSFLVSYVRARAECAVEKCKVGFWERGERTVYLALGLLFNNLAWVLWVLGFATHWTAFQRLYFSSRKTDESKKSVPFPRWIVPAASGRNNVFYFIKITVLFLAVLVFRPLF